MKHWARKFYSSPEWHACRQGFLASKNYLCERCLKSGKVTVAKIVHHKEYLTAKNINNFSVSLNWDNLESLCQECHNAEHQGNNKTARYRIDSYGTLHPL
ncbi:MAG: HNH endonuclease [Clostridiales bacterium]|jgi:5-methylcytosine-specific restriction endonuclease McrA|nr:HNH endonuclease [Clostridiales bacterium]